MILPPIKIDDDDDEQEYSSPFYIEKGQFPKTMIFLILTYLIIQLITSYRLPPYLCTNSQYIPINTTQGNITVDLEVTISDLFPKHKFIIVSASAVRNGSILPKSDFSFEIMTYLKLIKDSTLIQVQAPASIETLLTFGENSKESQQFQIAKEEISDFNLVNVKLSMSGNFDSIVGAVFYWSYTQHISIAYARIYKIVTSFFFAYSFYIFLSVLNLGSERFTKICCMILGIIGIIASLPIGFFMQNDSNGPYLWDYLIIGIFLNFFRFFIMTQFEMIYHNSSSPSTILAFFSLIFFVFYAIFESSALYDRASYIFNSYEKDTIILKSEYGLMYSIIIYGIYSIILIILSYCFSENYSNNRLYLFLFFWSLCFLSTIISNIIFPLFNIKMETIFPSMIVLSTHFTCAAVSLFFLHEGAEYEYEYANVTDQNQNGEMNGAYSNSDNALFDENDEGSDPDKEMNTLNSSYTDRLTV